MRPVNRGDAPRRYAKYQDAIGDLEDRLGKYCCYCEQRLPTSLEVEHVSPKSSDPDRETDWENFLLACKICNTVKGSQETNNQDFVWPDKDNTLLAIRYKQGGLVEAEQGISDEIQLKVVNLIDLVGLDRHIGKSGSKCSSKRDDRYKEREEVWKIAMYNRDELPQSDSDYTRGLLVTAAVGWGFFGVWMTVFKDDADLRQRLVNAFKGTAHDCFDEHCECVPREGGHI